MSMDTFKNLQAIGRGIRDLLRKPDERLLEQIESAMALHLANVESSACLAIWLAMIDRPADFGVDAQLLRQTARRLLDSAERMEQTKECSCDS